MNIIKSSFPSISLTIFFILSSNSPLYLVPATALAISRVSILLLSKLYGTLPSIILLASSSTIAVLPTPASPIKRGLFLHLRDNISISLSTSLSLPITGSSSLFLALFVRSTASSSI